MKRILFVDDEVMVLNGLKRLLRSYRKEWDIHFATSASEGLSLLEKDYFDVVVSDMRMPEMDGATFLNIVKEKYPHIMRIVLSGQSQLESVYKSLGATHQYLSKPCDPESLKFTIGRASTLQNLFKNKELKELVSQIESLPSVPELYVKIMEEAESPNMSMKRIGEILSQDIAMTAKILHLVNSAFFGLSKNISDPIVAANLLGLDIIISLVLVVKVFMKFEGKEIPSFSLESEWQHSMRVAEYAKKIAESEKMDKINKDQIYLAALLHDCGKMILADNIPETYEKIIVFSEEEHMELIEKEVKVLGVSHATVGAYLMNLWGLSPVVVESIAFHHEIASAENDSDSLVGKIVYFANLFDRISSDNDNGKAAIAELKVDEIQKNQFYEWRTVCIDVLNSKMDRKHE